MYKKIALLFLFVNLVLVNWSIIKKENHLAEGRIVYLDLAPADPRSLMQGDYMALHFQMANAVYQALPKKKGSRSRRQNVAATDGYVIAALDDQNRATFKALYTNTHTLNEKEIRLRYRVRNGQVKFATNAFFFQEGHAKYYEPARYGRFRVDGKGELLLAGMYDADLNRLAANQ